AVLGRHVGHHGDRLDAEFPDLRRRLVQGCLPPGTEGDPAALPRQLDGGAPADSPAGAGDECRLPAQSQIHLEPPPTPPAPLPPHWREGVGGRKICRERRQGFPRTATRYGYSSAFMTPWATAGSPSTTRRAAASDSARKTTRPKVRSSAVWVRP